MKQIAKIFNCSGFDGDVASICLCEGPTMLSMLTMIIDRFRRFHKVKLSIDFDDLWGDLVALYKSRSYDENSQIMITINGSVSTVDAGGPRR